MHIGIDFGTTNSGAAWLAGQEVHMFSLDPAAGDPTVMPSILYITREHEILVGKEAIDTYYQQNIGRPSKKVRQYVGEIEQTFAEVGTFIKDVYVMVDELLPGRLLRSLKSGLATGYQGTTIFGKQYTLEELVSIYLRRIKERVEAEAGQPVQGVVLGRPVHFVGDSAQNQLAEDRLRRAAHMAGFREIAFELEPVAAALHYERMIDHAQHIVVFDFGGGTLDITVMRVGGSPDDRKVFATGGIGIAGDVFDQRIVQNVLLEHFGRGSLWGEEKDVFPNSYTDALTNWQTVLELNQPDTLRFLQLAQLTGSNPARVRALESLLINNYAVRMFDEVERAKIALSDARFATITLSGEDIAIWQPVTRSQFEAMIARETQRIEKCLLDTLHRSGLRADQIDAVVRTGGSSQIPCFIEMLGRIFDPQKVRLSSVFGGVTAGLAVRAAT